MNKLYKSFFIGLMCVFMSANAFALSYKKIDSQVKNLTNVQFKQYSSSLIGSRVKWTGMVTDVTKNWLNSNYEVKMDMDKTGVYDVSFDVSKNLALQLKKNGYYKFSGTIKRITSVLGTVVVTLEKVKFE